MEGGLRLKLMVGGAGAGGGVFVLTASEEKSAANEREEGGIWRDLEGVVRGRN